MKRTISKWLGNIFLTVLLLSCASPLFAQGTAVTGSGGPAATGEQRYSPYLTVCVSGCSSTVTANTSYNSSPIRLMVDGYNAARVRINYAGTSAGSADLQVLVYSSTDCVTADTHQDDRGVVHTPRATVTGFASYVTFFMAAPCAIIKVNTMPIIPAGNASISITAIRQVYAAPPANCMRPDMSFGFCWQGTAEFGRVQGGYTFNVEQFNAAPAAGNCIASIWNNSSAAGATPIRIVIRGIDFQGTYNSQTADTTATLRAVRLIRLSADTALTAVAPQPTDSVFLAALGTYRNAPAGGACTTTGNSISTYWMAQVQGVNVEKPFTVPGESGKITLRPGEGVGLLVVANPLVAAIQGSWTFHLDEEP